MWWLYALLVLGIVWIVWHRSPRLRSITYDALIVDMTTQWYRATLERLPAGTHFLDVGIGTGTALVRNEDLMMRRSLRVTGIDYDADYVAKCSALFKEHQWTQKGVDAAVHHASVYDWLGGPYDAAYFSGSLMIMPDRPRALTHVATLLKPGGKIYVTQTFEEKPSRFLEALKPVFKYLLTIDFGSVTYAADFDATVSAARMRVVERVVIKQLSRRSYNLLILQNAN